MPLRLKTTTGLASSTVDFTGNWLVYLDITIYSVCTLEYIPILCSVWFSFHIFFSFGCCCSPFGLAHSNDFVDVFIRSMVFSELKHAATSCE